MEKRSAKKEDFEKDMMSRELVLKLALDIPPENVEEKLSLIREHFDSLNNTGIYHPMVIQLKKDEQMAFIYWEAGQFDQSAFYYEKILNELIPGLAPNSYSMAAFMVIRCFRLTKNYSKSLVWAEQILNKPALLSPFGKLDVLSEYIDLLNETIMEFNEEYVPHIVEIITDLGFPVVYGNNPIESIAKIKELNRKWSIKIPRMNLNETERKEIWEKYIGECEVGWYKQYAKEKLDKMLNGTT